jgi:putative membrane protein
MMWWDDGGWGAGQWLLMTMTMLIFWGGLIAFGVWAVRSFTVRPSVAPPPPAAVTSRADEVLADRYARGEIDEAEYARRREVLHPTTK